MSSDHTHDHPHSHGGHGHSHGLIDPSIKRSRAGIRAVLLSLLVLGVTALIQVAIFASSGSIALLADLIHNFGDAATAIPLGIAFALRSEKAERGAGYFVVLAIFVSACVAGYEAVERLLNPEDVSHVGALAAAGILGFAGNMIAAVIRSRAGRASTARRSSPMATTPAPMPTSASQWSPARSRSLSACRSPTR